MTAETVDAKGRRLLDSGHVQVVKLMARTKLVTVVGDSGLVHRCIWQARTDAWLCSCRTPARVRCSHIAAAELAVLRRTPPTAVVWRTGGRGWVPRMSP
jgi:hypothetical protein